MEKKTVSIGKCETYNPETVRAALEAMIGRLGGVGKFVKPGMKVLVKPNLLMASAPARACTTNPEFLIEVIKLLQEAGAIVSFGDLPGGFYAGGTARVHEATAMTRVAEATGAELVTLEKFGFKQIDIPDGKKIKAIHAPRYLDEVDAIVNVCKLKTHMQTMMTCALKNWFGLTTQQDRLLAHKNTSYVDFGEALVDIYSALPKAVLNICDAVVGMEGTGPSQGAPVKLGFALASGDAVALDTVAAVAIGFQPREISTIEAARRRGYCATRLREIEIAGDSLESITKKVKRPSSAIFMLMPMLTGPFNELTKVRPYVIDKKCKACGKCAEVCAGDAITFPKKTALISDKKCVLCFCCHEICPFDAVDIKKPFLVSIAERIAQK
ncbi:MAG: DUF362 domain-containing protein [bacterium]